MGTREKSRGGQVSKCFLRVSFLLVDTKEWHSVWSTKECCAQLLDREECYFSVLRRIVFFIFPRRGGVFCGQLKIVLYMSETERTVCVGWHGGHVGPSAVCSRGHFPEK